MNVKRKGVDVRRKDPIQAVVCNSEDQRLDWIQSFGVMCCAMAGKQGNRVRQLSKDTARAIYITCMGIVDLSKHLLDNMGYKYVCLGEFTTDPLEKAFSKLRQGSGGTYFINAQQVLEKLRISKAKLQLELNGTLAWTSQDINAATALIHWTSGLQKHSIIFLT